MKQPSMEELLEKLSAVLEGRLTREEVSDWAFEYVCSDRIQVRDFLAWDLLAVMAALDMPDFDRPQYLYSEKDLHAWLREYMEKSGMTEEKTRNRKHNPVS